VIAKLKIKRKTGYKIYEAVCSENSTVAGLLDIINLEESDPVEWECSCRQNMCGSCAMLINKRPSLACSAFVRNTGTDITLEPLSKFPLIKDLKVDRSIIHRLFEKMKVYIDENTIPNFDDTERQYLSASCLQCGCCMEVCPNYTGEDLFGGAMLMNGIFKTISQENSKKHLKELSGIYAKTQFGICTKALSCAEVCPVKLPQASTFSRLNAISLKNLL